MSYGLAPKASISNEEMAVVLAAAQALMNATTLIAPTPNVVPPWRFSGRWFATGPFSSQRRPRSF
ncbi:MAG: hypothetical protein WCG86_05330 [Actinomycetota bacterium]